MKRASFFFAVLSLCLGLALIVFTLLYGQTFVAVGAVFGVLLVVNSVIRIWVARSH